MMFKSAILASLFASVAASSFVPNGDIAADSKVGQKLMSKARALEQGGDMTWMTGYSIKYLGCTSLIQVNPEGGGEDDSLLYTQNLVKFGLCPSDSSCSSCGNGKAQYVVALNEFVDAWTESKMEAQQRKCENVRENCYCDNANDDEACEAACYEQMGMDYCIQYEDDEEFEVQRYLECAELEGGNNNNNNGNYYNYGNSNSNGVDMYRQYWMGPSCAANGKSINLAVFLDAGCSTKAKSGVYEAFNYGASLPYEKESLIKANECISCEEEQEEDENENYNYNNGYYEQQAGEVTELCQQTYESAAKCESGLSAGNYFYPDTSGCDYIKNILPKLSSATSKVVAGGGSSGPAVAFAVIFFLTSCVLGAYAFFLYRKIHRAKVNLAQSEGMTMA